MNLRLIEWIFAVIAPALLLAFTTIVFLRFGFPFFLINFVFLGLVGLIAVARDADEHSPYWGLLTWGVLGGLVSLNLMDFTRGLSPVLPLAWAAALALLAAALLADRRRGRLEGIPIWLFIALIGGVAHYYFTVLVYVAMGGGR